MVKPGEYTIKMKLGDQEWEQKAKIKMDPRVAEAGVTQADLAEQEELGLKLVKLQEASRQLANQIKQRKKELNKMMKESTDVDQKKRYQNEHDKITEREKQLVTNQGRYPQPMLIDQINYLSSMINRADQKPGKDAHDRYKELKGLLDSLKEDVLP